MSQAAKTPSSSVVTLPDVVDEAAHREDEDDDDSDGCTPASDSGIL